MKQRRALNEEYNETDEKNVVPQEVAEKFGFRPEYTGYRNGLEIWKLSIDFDPCEGEGRDRMYRLCSKLGIRRPTAYSSYPSKCIRITVEPKKEEKKEYMSPEEKESRRRPFTSKKEPVELDEAQLKRIIKKVVMNEMLNAPGRDAGADYDGISRYQGTGSPESKERVDRFRKESSKTGFKSRGLDFKRYGGKDSAYERERKNYGGFEDVPYDDKDTDSNGNRYFWQQFIQSLRNLASKNYSDSNDLTDFYLESFTKKLITRDGAKSFIKYLYKNGFHGEKR